jgi:hypothetical protein
MQFFSVSLLEFVLTDADQGAWLFQQLIQDEIREKYQRYIQVLFQHFSSRTLRSISHFPGLILNFFVHLASGIKTKIAFRQSTKFTFLRFEGNL